MGRKCSAYGCKSGYDSQQGISVDQLITIHRFPINNKELCEKWVLAANRRKDFKPTSNSGICSLHFVENDFVEYSQDQNSTRKKQNGEQRALCRRYLKKDAVPSLFENTVASVSLKPRPSTSTTSRNMLEMDRKQLAILEHSYAAEDNVSEIHDEIFNETATSKGFQIIFEDEKCDMPLKTTVSGKHFTNIAETLVKYRKNGFLCDAVLVAKCGQELRAHSALLAAVSPIFLIAIEEKPSSRPYHLCFPEVELEVLEIAVDFVYTGMLLLPPLYSQMDQLSTLFVKLSDLGISLQKLHECKMTFGRTAKQQPPYPAESIKLEVADNKPSVKDSVQTLQESGEWPVDKKPSSAGAFNKTMITDLTVNDARTTQTICYSVESSQNTLAKQKRQGNWKQERQKRKARNKNGKEERMLSNANFHTDTSVTKSGMRPAFSIRKSLLGNLNTPPTALQLIHTGSQELKNFPGSLLDQNVGKITTLDSGSNGIHQDIISGNGERNPKTQDGNFNVVDPSLTEEYLGTGVVEKLVDEAGITSNQVLTCEHCKGPITETFTTEIDLLWHKIKHHWDQCNICNYCGRKFSLRNNLRNHIKRHLGIYPRKNHKCNDCGLHFISPDRLKEHRRRHTGEKPYECPVCKKRFSLKPNMMRHKLIHTGDHPFLCNFCGKGFTRKTYLTNHVTVHHEFDCALCSCRQTSKADMEKHALEVHQLDELVRFNSIIKKPRTYLCHLCGKNCNSACSLHFHIRGHKKKPVHCKTYGNTSSKSHGLRFIMSVDTGERPFVCDICQKGFTQRSNLMMHLTIHSGIKSFECIICSKSFAGKGQLKEHIKQHTMTVSHKKLFVCGICNKQFSSKGYLSVHHKIHTGEKPYWCRICSRQFTDKSSLIVHNRTHTGDKPFSCTVCKMSFTQSQHVTRHMRTHTGEKPFVCEICSKSYKNKIDLRYHFLRFHKIDITSKSLSENTHVDRTVKVPDATDRSDCIVDELKHELDI